MASPFRVGDLYDLARVSYEQQFYGDESGSVRQPFMSQEQFNALPERQRFDMAGQYTTGGTNVYRDENQNLVGYGDPRFIEAGAERWTVDPNQIQRSGDGRFSIASGNVNQGALDAIQRQTDQSGFFNGTPLQNIMKGAGIVLGAGALNNWMMDGSIFGAGGGTDLGQYGGLAPEEAMGTGWGNASPGAGYMGDPYSLDPGFFDSAGNAVGNAAAPGGNSWWQNALNYAGKNPINAARGVGGLLGAATSLSGNQSPQGSSSGYQGPSGPVPSFNPVGAAGQFQQSAYKPMQFDPVPFMGDSTMFQNYSPYNSGFTGMGMPGQNPTMQSQYQNVLAGGGYQGAQGNYGPPGGMNFGAKPVWGRGSAEGIDQVLAGIRPGSGAEHTGYAGGNMSPGGYQNQWGMGYNQASPVQLPWMQNPSFGKPYMQGPSSQPPMGYTGSGPMPPGMTGNGFNPVPLPSPSNSGGLLGNIGQQPSMSSRDMQMMARYLPGSGTTVDPNASPNALQNRFGGNFQNMIPQRLQGKWQQFQQLAGPMNSYEDWRNRYPGM